MPDFEQSDAPRDITIEDEKRMKYEELSTNERSPFHEAELNDIFVFAVAYGFDQGLQVPLEGDRRALANVSALSRQQEWLIKSIVIKHFEDGGVLKDGSRIYKIAQEFANGGIDELYSLHQRPGDSFKELSEDVIQVHEDRE